MSRAHLRLLVIGDHQENCTKITDSLVSLGAELSVHQVSGSSDLNSTPVPHGWDLILMAFKDDGCVQHELATITNLAGASTPVYVVSGAGALPQESDLIAAGSPRCFAENGLESNRYDLNVILEKAEMRHELLEAREECQELTRKNVAWRELFDQVNEENRQIKAQVAANVERALIPAIQELKQSPLSKVRRLAILLEQGVAEIASPFLCSLQNNSASLSPRELEVCHLIRSGLSSKEIAATLRLSPTTVQKHRELIRKKLGIVNLHTNLQVYLQSI